jgi:hypothetical protein
MGKEFTLSIVRHLLTGLGAVLIQRGYADAATVDAVIGGALAIAGLALSYADKARRA